MGEVTRLTKMMNRRQYLDMRYEAFRNDGLIPSNDPNASEPYLFAPDLTVWDTTRETNWQKELLGGIAQATNVYGRLTGGSAMLQYLISGDYQKQTTVFSQKLSDQRGSIHFGLNSSSVNQKLKTSFKVSYLIDDNKLPSVDLTFKANYLSPVSPALLDEDGTLNWALDPDGVSAWSDEHPMAGILYSTYSLKTVNLVSSFQASYSITKGLEMKVNTGYTSMNRNSFKGFPLIYFSPADRPFVERRAEYGSGVDNTWIVEPQISYKTFIWKGNLSTFIGSTIQQSRNTKVMQTGTGHASDQVIEDVGSAAIVSVTSSLVEYKYHAVFGHLDYNVDDTYIISLNGRRDGSSRFGSNNRFHDFGSAGIAWVFSNKSFFKNKNILSFGKLRASYGTTGSDGIGDYAYLSLYRNNTGPSGYLNAPGSIPGLPHNPDLQWEQTRKLQLGMDLGFIQDRLNLRFSYARNRSSNQLLGLAVPSTVGSSTFPINFPATVQNTSFEFELSSVNIKRRKFEWSSQINVTIPRNKLVEFPNLDKTSSFRNSLVIGQPLGLNKIYRLAGVDPLTGAYQFYDRDNNVTFTPTDNDRELRTQFPKFYGGFENRFSYRGIELTFLFQFIKQTGSAQIIESQAILPGSFARSVGGNQPVFLLDRWQQPGDYSIIQRFTTDRSGFIDQQLTIAASSDLKFVDASFARLKNLSLSWMLPTEWTSKAKLQNLRLFAQAQNLLTFTKYPGADPENQGYSILPPLRIISFGLQLEL
jgi:TonB-dependent starch-binding outer membrane protein SusC